MTLRASSTTACGIARLGDWVARPAPLGLEVMLSAGAGVPLAGLLTPLGAAAASGVPLLLPAEVPLGAPGPAAAAAEPAGLGGARAVSWRTSSRTCSMSLGKEVTSPERSRLRAWFWTRVGQFDGCALREWRRCSCILVDGG